MEWWTLFLWSSNRTLLTYVGHSTGVFGWQSAYSLRLCASSGQWPKLFHSVSLNYLVGTPLIWEQGTHANRIHSLLTVSPLWDHIPLPGTAISNFPFSFCSKREECNRIKGWERTIFHPVKSCFRRIHYLDWYITGTKSINSWVSFILDWIFWI